MKYLNKLLLLLGLGDHTFNAMEWKRSPHKRKCFVKDILREKIGIGMNVDELVETFGEERTIYLNGMNSYRVSAFKKGITTDGNTSKTLDFYMDRNGTVTDIRLKILRRS